MNKLTLFGLALGLLLPAWTEADSWKMKPIALPTRWSALVSPTNALPEYPRPQLVRTPWQNLNGLWDYAISAKDGQKPRQFQGKILVPYPLESALSGVQSELQENQWLWYRRTFTVNAGPQMHTLLHFEAVDFEAKVYVNGEEIGLHSGGYEHFSYDITKSLRPGENELVVRVWDPTDSGRTNPHGKQGFQHTATSGIWQTVWLEPVPAAHIESLRMTPDVDRSLLDLKVSLVGTEPGDMLEATVRSNSAEVARATFPAATELHIAHPRLWSPDDPFLYDIEVRLLRGTRVVDRITSYFGLRKIQIRADAAGIPRIFLNNRYTYNLATLDRGWWPDGIYTAPTDAALQFDIEATKAMGFNTIRKHVKVEPDRWYFHCDRLGVLVWQDMVNPAIYNPGALTPQARAQFEQEVGETLPQLYNHPSITMWVLFNEGWGAYDQDRLTRWIKQLDPSRLLDADSGRMDLLREAQWTREEDPTKPRGADFLESVLVAVTALDPTGSDVSDLHHYPDPRMPPAEVGKAQVLGEHGGIGVVVDGHVWNDLEPPYSPSLIETSPDQFPKIYAGFVDRLKQLQSRGLSGSVYTNPFDVEQGQYGLLTYDRSIIKIPVAVITKLNEQLIPRAKNYAAATRDFSAEDVDLTPESQRYAALLEEYQRGRRELPFLNRLTLMALRQDDQLHATEVGNAVIAAAERPYTKEVWSFIQAVTRTSKDAGFNILLASAEAADKVLGPNAAEIKVRAVIRREQIKPEPTNSSGVPSWDAMERRVGAKYGTLGKEAVYGEQMMYSLAHNDWREFGRAFPLYFKTAFQRSDYPINGLSWSLCKEVASPGALDVAITAMQWNIQFASADSGRAKDDPMKARDDPTQFDTYACLLSKRGKPEQALKAQEEAVRLSEGRDAQINLHLAKLRAGLAVWVSPSQGSVPCDNKPGITFICGPRNSEDLSPIPDSPWLIASGLADPNGFGGALYLINRHTNEWRILYPNQKRPNIDAVASASPCPGPVDPSRFSAHGIHLRQGAGQRHTLYVVNHGTRESIEIFEVNAATQEPSVLWKGCLILPGSAVGNAVAPLPDGGLVVTVSNLADDKNVDEEAKAGQPTGYVVEWHATSGWEQLPESAGSFPNGIEVSPDGHWLYVTNTGTKDIVRLSRTGERGQRSVIKTQILTDNVRWDLGGKILWIAGQLEFCGAEPVCDVQYAILRLDPMTLHFTQVAHPPTAPGFGAGTTALPLESEVWVGTYQGDRIARLQLAGMH
jgi:Glycosyl hydrolases family 2, sugar binding domain/Glycosyl hydrolases family 2/Glycosyl hydrolases family 2, TIM barrel domain